MFGQGDVGEWGNWLGPCPVGNCYVMAGGDKKTLWSNRPNRSSAKGGSQAQGNQV